MTDLLYEAPEDAEEILISWLSPLRPTDRTRVAGDPLPFTLVQQIGGRECEEEFTSEALVSVRTLCDKSLGEAAAAAEAKATHRRMLLLARSIPDITLPGGRVANVDYVNVVQSSAWLKYDNSQILCKLGRYAIGLTYVSV